MKRVANIGGLLKKLYRLYTAELLTSLQERGFTDLRPSFLEILITIAELDGPNIRDIGLSCGLKKQTMTSHLNELLKRGYITKVHNPEDKREYLVRFSDHGEKFKLNLLDSIEKLEQQYIDKIGEVELDRVEFVLKNVHTKLN